MRSEVERETHERVRDDLEDWRGKGDPECSALEKMRGRVFDE